MPNFSFTLDPLTLRLLIGGLIAVIFLVAFQPQAIVPVGNLLWTLANIYLSIKSGGSNRPGGGNVSSSGGGDDGADISKSTTGAAQS